MKVLSDLTKDSISAFDPKAFYAFTLYAGENITIPLTLNAGFDHDINSITAKLVSGTISVSITINGTTVTGLNAVAITTSKTTTNATALNSVVATDEVHVVFSSNSSATIVHVTVNATKVT